MAVINVDDIYILDNTGQQVDDAVDYGLFNSNDNLLDNAYFVGGGSQLGDGIFPVNQRGQTSYTGGRSIDRWRCWQASTVTLTAQGLTFTTGANGDGLFQYFSKGKFESLYGETVTASLLLADRTLYTATGTASADCWIATSFSGGYFGYVCNGTEANFRINLAANQSKSIKACKLEKGTVSTLANDVPPDFGEELAKCQRRLFRVSPMGTASRGYAGFGSANSSKNILAFVPTPVTLAAQPTVSFSNCNAYNYVAGGSIAISSISIDSWTQNGVFLSCVPSDVSQVVQYQPYVLRVAQGGYLQFSAEI